MRLFTIFFVFYTSSVVQSTRHTNLRFDGFLGFDGKVSKKDILGSFHSDSPILCCAICKKNSSCLSAFYNNNNKTCILYYGVFKGTKKRLTSEAGSKSSYYKFGYSVITEVKIKATSDVAATTKSLETTLVSGPAGQVDVNGLHIPKYFINEPVPFEVAVDQCIKECRTDFCHLAWIDSAKENEEVTKIISASSYPVTTYFYIGHILDGHVITHFPNSSNEVLPSYEGNFAFRNNISGCIGMLPSGKWITIDCHEARPSVCEHA